MKLAPCLVAAMLFSASSLVAQPTLLDSEVGPPEPIDRTTTTHDVKIDTDGGLRMTVPVSVAGRGPYRFLVDTGSERTIISRQLARQLSLQAGRNTILHSVIGVNDVQTVRIPDLRFSTKMVSINNAPALEAHNIGADGMLGIDSLRSQRVLFDFKAGIMSITPSLKKQVRIGKDEIVVRANMRKGRLIFTKAHIEGQQVTVIIDTGSQVTIGNRALERALVRRRIANAEAMTIQSVTGELLEAQYATLKELQLGNGVGLSRLPVAFADAHIFRKLDLENRPAMLLGMNALRAFDRMSIDFAAKKVRFVLPSTSMREDIQLAEARPI